MSDANGQRDKGPAFSRRRIALQQGLPLLATLYLVWLLRNRIAGIDLTEVGTAFAAVEPWQWAAALGATLVSFLALGEYDAALHRQLGTGLSDRAARRAGMTAIALSQTLGMGLLTGALVRWRMLPTMGAVQAARVTAFVAISFLAAWAVLTATAVALLPPVPLEPWRSWAIGLSAVICLGLVLTAFCGFGGRRGGRLPTLPTIARVLVWAAVDTLAAAAALWLLFPGDLAIGFPTFVPVFLLALGAGMVIATPGGVGPFEIALLTLSPALPTEPVLAAVLAYRALYFALPALIAVVVLARGAPHEEAAPDSPSLRWPTAFDLARAEQAHQAEVQVIRQGEHRFLPSGGGLVVARAGQFLVGLFDPCGPRAHAAHTLADLERAARDEARMACLYKCSAAVAARARRQGYRVLAVAEDCRIVTTGFTTGGPGRARLRRKLRRAADAGVIVAAVPPGASLPLGEMAALARGWAARQGGERGFSMGRYSRAYVTGQHVYLAWCDRRLVAFATFHDGQTEWALDLMRSTPDMPDGAMHALVAAAIADARAAGVARVSLAALPRIPPLVLSLPGAVGRRTRAALAAPGLRQFKESFAPAHVPLYLVTRGWPQLVLALCDIAVSVRRPPPLIDDAVAGPAHAQLRPARSGPPTPATPFSRAAAR